MTYRGHMAGGVLAAAALVAPLALHPVTKVAACVACLLGALAPDLDNPGAYLSRRLGPLPYLFRLAFSNPVTWQLAGGDACNHWPGAVPPRDRWASWWYDNPLTRVLVSPRLAARLGRRSVAGRARLRALASHRQLSHSLLGLFLVVLLIAALLSLGGFLASEYGVLPISTIPWRIVGPVTILVPSYASTVSWTTLGFATGYGSHLALDMLTVSGVPLLLPSSTRRFWLLPKPLRLRTR